LEEESLDFGDVDFLEDRLVVPAGVGIWWGSGAL
jgi:hypothetical protein